MAQLLSIGAGYRSQLLVAVAVAFWGADVAGLIPPDAFEKAIQILGIVFGGTMAAKVQRLVAEMKAPE